MLIGEATQRFQIAGAALAVLLLAVGAAAVSGEAESRDASRLADGAAPASSQTPREKRLTADTIARGQAPADPSKPVYLLAEYTVGDVRYAMARYTGVDGRTCLGVPEDAQMVSSVCFAKEPPLDQLQATSNFEEMYDDSGVKSMRRGMYGYTSASTSVVTVTDGAGYTADVPIAETSREAFGGRKFFFAPVESLKELTITAKDRGGATLATDTSVAAPDVP